MNEAAQQGHTALQLFCERFLGKVWQQALLCLLAGLCFRAGAFGDPNIHPDEGFYYFIGHALHNGALLYVDIWDRKPPGLFLLYYLIAAISPSIYAYQVTAWLFASATAFVIVRIALRWVSAPAALIAAACYLAMLNPMGGLGGQSPVFYNLYIAVAVLLTLKSVPALQSGRVPLQVYLAMGLCGLAIATKQTAFFESVFLGLFVLGTLVRAGVRPGQILCFAGSAMMLGILPMALCAAYFVAIGHWAEFWQAMVTSNLTKTYFSAFTIRHNFLLTFSKLLPLLACASLGLLLTANRPGNKQGNKPGKIFLSLWVLAAFAGFLAVPNFYEHYALSLLVPLYLASAFIFERKWFGGIIASALIIFAAYLSGSATSASHQLSQTAMADMADAIRSHMDDGGLFIYEGPSILYALTDTMPMSPLVFPQMFTSLHEVNVSHLDTKAELRRIIARRPSAIVMIETRIRRPADPRGLALLKQYVTENCAPVYSGPLYSPNGARPNYVIYGDCTSES